MMFPRLILARTLLPPDGVIAIHIDENEQAHLELLLKEVFGEAQFLGAVVWDKRNPKGDVSGVAVQHETILFATRDRQALTRSGGLTRRKKGAQAMLARAAWLFARLGLEAVPAELEACARAYRLPDSVLRPWRRIVDLETINAEFADWVKRQDLSGGEAAYRKIDANGEVYRLVSMAWPNRKRPPDEFFTPLHHPVTGRPCPVPARGWRNSPATMRELLATGRIVFGPDHTTQPQRKYLLRENLREALPSILAHGGSDDGLLRDLGIPFDHPKPVDVAVAVLDAVLHDGDLVLDFFAGSGTTAHAVLELNRDGGRRRFLLVQAPEPCDPSQDAGKAALAGGLTTVFDVTLARVRKVRDALPPGDPRRATDIRVWRLAPVPPKKTRQNAAKD